MARRVWAKLNTLKQTALSGQLVHIVPHYYHSWRNAGRIDATPPVRSAPYGESDALELVMLTNEANHRDLMIAAKSFLRWYPGRAALTVYGDATLTPATASKLQAHLPDAQIWLRTERDQLVEPLLAGLPHCSAFRRVNVFAAKIIDCAILGRGRQQLLHDSDVLSFGPTELLMEWATSSKPMFAFGRDVNEEPYAISALELGKLLGATIRPALNAGFCMVPRQLIDLEQLEQWLAIPDYPAAHHFGEQMLWPALADRAVTAGRAEFAYFPIEYNMGRTRPDAESRCRLVHYCGHFLSATRTAMRSIGQPRAIRDVNRK